MAIYTLGAPMAPSNRAENTANLINAANIPGIQALYTAGDNFFKIMVWNDPTHTIKCTLTKPSAYEQRYDILGTNGVSVLDTLYNSYADSTLNFTFMVNPHCLFIKLPPYSRYHMAAGCLRDVVTGDLTWFGITSGNDFKAFKQNDVALSIHSQSFSYTDPLGNYYLIPAKLIDSANLIVPGNLSMFGVASSFGPDRSVIKLKDGRDSYLWNSILYI